MLPCRKHGSQFENHKTAFEEGAARDDALIEDELAVKNDSRPTSVWDDEKEKEKGSVERV
jgi:hypothetical protein